MRVVLERPERALSCRWEVMWVVRRDDIKDVRVAAMF